MKGNIMTNNEKFEKVYEKILDENVFTLEKQREEAKKEQRKTIIIVIGIIIGMFVLVNVLQNSLLKTNMWTIQKSISMMSMLINFVMLFAICIIILGKKKKASKSDIYKESFKNNVIKPIINSFSDTIEYRPELGILSSIFDESEPKHYDRYQSEDLMCGKLNSNCDFRMAEIKTQEEYRQDGKTKTYTVFEGLFARIETPKAFKETIYIKENTHDGNFLVRMFSTGQSYSKLRVQLDSQEFEKQFDVYATNKIIAMQLLTADIMEKLIGFYNETKIEYEITIKDNYIYLTFSTGKMFEPASYGKFSMDKETLHRYYRILDFTLGLSNMLIDLINETQYE